MRLLDEVLANSSLAKHHADARTYQADIARYWKRITRMTKSVRGTNHPVVKFIVDAGNAAHEEYQKDSSQCDEYEFSVPGGRVDCLKVDDSGCWIIELKPDNRASINKGREQIFRYTRALKAGTDAHKGLVAKNKKFATCADFKTRIDCYTLCPKVDDDGEYTAVTPKWRANCH